MKTFRNVGPRVKSNETPISPRGPFFCPRTLKTLAAGGLIVLWYVALLVLAFFSGCSGGGGSGPDFDEGPGAPSPTRGIARALSAGATIIDNGQAGTSFVGSWIASGGAFPYGSVSLYSKTVSGTYSWQAELAPGRYEVLLWWTTWPSRPTAAPVEVLHAGGTFSTTVNQQTNGGAWNLIGTFDFASSGKVTIRSTSASLATCADAACFNPVGAITPVEIIIDDSKAGTSKLGTWAKSGGASPYGTQSLYANKAGAWYAYERSIPVPATYDVFAWWTDWPSRERQVPYEISTSEGPVTVQRDQLTGGGQWQLLGRFQFAGVVKVTVRCPGTKTVCADAVRFAPATAPPPPPPLTDRTLEWTAPTLNADGTACTDLEGYTLAWGEDPDALVEPEDVGMTTTATIEDLAPGTYFATATAYDDDGNESGPSNLLEFTVP